MKLKRRHITPDRMIKIIAPMLSIFLLGLVAVCINIFLVNRDLAERFIVETGSLSVSGFNSEFNKISSDIIQKQHDSSDIAKIPSTIDSRQAAYYPLIGETREHNRVMKALYQDVREIFVYNQRSEMLIGTGGTIFTNSQNTGFLGQIRGYLDAHAIYTVTNVHWEIMEEDEEKYIIGWYGSNTVIAGCVMNLSTVVSHMDGLPKEFDVSMVLETGDGARYPLDSSLSAEESSNQLYSYRLGTVGTLHMYLTRRNGPLRNLYVLQTILGIFLLRLVAAAIFTLVSYYRMSTALYQKELNESRTNLDFLQEQIRPHFFLNCLSIIHSMADKEEEKDILQMSELLSDYVRATFQNEDNMRTIREEINQVSAFIQIQKKRYGEDAFGFEMAVDEELMDCRIPQLTIHTMVENSFMHAVGLDQSIEIALFVTRETIDQEPYIYICVSDTGPGYDDEILQDVMSSKPIVYAGRRHIGLQNIKQRLELLYQGKARFEISNMDEHYGAVTEVWIPIEESNEKSGVLE